MEQRIATHANAPSQIENRSRSNELILKSGTPRSICETGSDTIRLVLKQLNLLKTQAPSTSDFKSKDLIVSERADSSEIRNLDRIKNIIRSYKSKDKKDKVKQIQPSSNSGRNHHKKPPLTPETIDGLLRDRVRNLLHDKTNRKIEPLLPHSTKQSKLWDSTLMNQTLSANHSKDFGLCMDKGVGDGARSIESSVIAPVQDQYSPVRKSDLLDITQRYNIRKTSTPRYSQTSISNSASVVLPQGAKLSEHHGEDNLKGISSSLILLKEFSGNRSAPRTIAGKTLQNINRPYLGEKLGISSNGSNRGAVGKPSSKDTAHHLSSRYVQSKPQSQRQPIEHVEAKPKPKEEVDKEFLKCIETFLNSMVSRMEKISQNMTNLRLTSVPQGGQGNLQKKHDMIEELDEEDDEELKDKLISLLKGKDSEILKISEKFITVVGSLKDSSIKIIEKSKEADQELMKSLDDMKERDQLVYMQQERLDQQDVQLQQMNELLQREGGAYVQQQHAEENMRLRTELDRCYKEISMKNGYMEQAHINLQMYANE